MKTTFEHFLDFCKKEKIDFDRFEAYYYGEYGKYPFVRELNIAEFVESRRLCAIDSFTIWAYTEEGRNYWEEKSRKWIKYYEEHCL